MHKSLFRWRLGATVLIICLMLAFNSVVILAQDATDEPPAASTEPTETETPLPIPTDIPTVSPPLEEPTLTPTEEVVVPSETPLATETLTPEATEAATQEVTEVVPTVEVPAETPTVVAPVTEEPPLSLLVRELFDNGDFSPWLAGAGWSLAASESGLALQVVNSNDPIVLQKGAFYNLAIQTRFLWATGSAQISVRQTAVGNYTVSINANGVITLKRAGEVAASSVVAPVPAGTWRTLRLSAINDVIRVSVDDVEVIVYTDIAPLPPGEVSLSADFNPAPGDVNPTPEIQTLLADDFFLWVPLAELGLYPAPTPIAPATVPPTEPPPAEVPTEVVVEPTVEVTEVVVEATAEPTEVPGEVTPTKPAEQAGQYDDLTQAVGKDVSDVPPPSAEELASAQDAPNDNFGLAQSVILNGSGFYVFSNGTVDATMEGSEPVPVCGNGLAKTVWFAFDTASIGAGAGVYTFSTAGSSFDTIMGIYTGTALNNLAPFGCNDDASTSLITSQLTVTLAASTTYYIQVGGFKGRYGAITFRVQKGAVPAALAAPLLQAPNTGVTSNLTTPDFTWNKVANANSYEIQVATNATFTLNLQSQIRSSSTCGALTCIYNGFNLTNVATTTYYWRVRGRNLNDVNGPFSLVRTYIYRTSAPILSAPLDNAVVTNSKQPLSWAVYPGATSYTIQLAKDSNFTIGVQTLPPFTPPSLVAATITYTPTTPSIQGDWYWRVAATPALGSGPTAYSTPRKFTLNIESLPANNAIITLAGVATTANVTFSWVAVPGATTGYKVYVSNAPDMSAATQYTPALPTSLSVIATGLNAGVYYWYVEPLLFAPPTSPNVPPSIIRKFTISPPAPLAPPLVNPPTGAITNNQTPTLDWGPTTTTAGGPTFTYDIQIATTATFTAASLVNVAPAQTGLTLTDYTPSTNLNPATYYWRVRTVNTHGVAGAYSVARSLIVRPFILSAPLDNALTTDQTPAFTWLPITYPAATPPPVMYELQVDDASDFSGGIFFTKTDLTTTSYMMVAPTDPTLAYGKWYWRVLISIDGGINYNLPGAPGDKRTLFVTQTVPLPPVLQLPANLGVTNDTTPTLQWKGSASPVGTPFSYEVQVSTVNTFLSTVWVSPAPVDGSACSPTILCSTTVGATLSNGVAYFWRVRTINNTLAPSVYSAVFKFTVDTTAPAIPTQNLPANNAVTNLVRPTLTWLTTATAAKYHVVVNPTNTCAVSGATKFNFTTATPVLAQALTVAVMPTPLAQGEYFWCVEALDAATNASGFQASPHRFVVNLSNVPADNANIIAPAGSIRPTFSWAASGLPAGVTYTLKIDDSPDMLTPVYTSLTPITALSQAIPLTSPALTYGTYYWQVVVTGAPALDATIVKRKFIVTPALPAAPGLFGPTSGSSSFTMPLLDWNPVTLPVTTPQWTVDHYEVQIATNATFTLNFQSFNTLLGTDTQYQMPALTQGTYYWRVRAYNQYLAPGAFSLVRSFIIDSTGTLVPTLTAPIDNSSSGVKTPTFVWTKPVGAVKFELRYSLNYPASYTPGDQLNTTGTVTQTILTLTSYKHPSPLIPGTYYWQVRAFDAANNPSAWSNLKTFKIFSLPTDTPQPNRFGPVDPILLTWGPLSWVTDGTPGNGYYEVQIDDNSNFSSPAFQRTNALGTPIYYDEYVTGNNYGVVIPAGALPTGLPNGTWYWRVRGFNPTVLPSGAYGAYSSTGTFVVDK